MMRSYAAYSLLLAKLKKVEPNIDDVKATITDEEPGLAGAEPSFYNWILKHAALMQKSMILGVRSAPGLSQEDSCMANDAESNNHVLNSAAHNKEISSIDFICLSKSLALNLQQEVVWAILKSRGYRFKTSIQAFR